MFNYIEIPGGKSSPADLSERELVKMNTLIRLLAHEIRNPLNALVLNLKVVEKKLEDASIKEAVAASLKQTERINSILTDFVDFTKPKYPKYRNVNVNSLVNDLETFIRPQAAMKSLTVITDTNGIPEYFVTDPDLLNQALLNLLINAVEVTAEGNVTIFARTKSEDGNGRRLVIGVEDSGPGFACEIDAFKPFYSTKEGGTGLGLTAAAAIASAFGGRVAVENTGKGARVFLDIPEGTPE